MPLLEHSAPLSPPFLKLTGTFVSVSISGQINVPFPGIRTIKKRFMMLFFLCAVPKVKYQPSLFEPSKNTASTGLF